MKAVDKRSKKNNKIALRKECCYKGSCRARYTGWKRLKANNIVMKFLNKIKFNELLLLIPQLLSIFSTAASASLSLATVHQVLTYPTIYFNFWWSLVLARSGLYSNFMAYGTRRFNAAFTRALQ